MQKRQKIMLSINKQEQNVFLTTPSPYNSNQNNTHQYNQRVDVQNSKKRQRDVLIQNIFNLIVQFKHDVKKPQIKHLFNELLLSINLEYFQKKNDSQIKILLKGQENIIKLKRMYNQLRQLKKRSNDDPQLLGQKDKENNKKFNQIQKQIGKYHKNDLNLLKSTKIDKNNFLSETFSQKFHISQYKQKLIKQISYREKKQKFKSQVQTHEQKRNLLISQKVQKLKQRNKKVKQIQDKNKLIQRLQYSKYKYQVLFDPQEINQIKKNRNKTLNQSLKNTNNYDSSLNQDLSNDNQRNKNLSQKSIINKFKRQNQDFKDFQIDRKNELKTSQTSKQLVKYEGTMKSFKNLFNNNDSFEEKQLLKIKKAASSMKLCSGVKIMNLSNLVKKGQFSKNFQIKHRVTLEKKQQIASRKQSQFIEEVIRKEQKIMKVIQRKKMGFFSKKISPVKQQRVNVIQEQNLRESKSFQNSPQKNRFKKVFMSRKQLIDKQNRILMKIENKIQNKNIYLQQRVNRIRQRLKRQQQIKQNHKRKWKEYISMTQNVSLSQSRNKSASNKMYKKSGIRNKNYNIRQKGNQQNSQQKIIKLNYTLHNRRMKKDKYQQQLLNLSLEDLKKKLQEIQTQQINAFQKTNQFK